MPADAFLKISDLPGESTDSEHRGEIEIMSVTWDVVQGANPLVSAGGNLATGKSALGTVRVAKLVDRASPRLYLAYAAGDHFREATLTWRRPINNQQRTYLVFKLSDVMVSRVLFAEQPSQIGNEEVALSYARIEWTYTRFNPDGAAAGNSSAGWDLTANAAI
jgi:type VI secretion system secreted protein Hcp